MSQSPQTQTGFAGIVPDSIYIPRVFNNITAERIRYVFKSLDLGHVSHVDFVPRLNSNDAKMAFIHFESWNIENPACQHLIERIHDPNREARVVYEDPYYWLLFPNHNSSSSNMYNAYNLRCEMNELRHSMLTMNKSIQNMSNVLDTLLSDFYDIPKPNTNETAVNTNISNICADQNKQTKCKICSVLFTPQPQCPACQTPIDADEELLSILSTRPTDNDEEYATFAINKINEFMESKKKNTSDENTEKENNQNQNQISSGWTWFS